MTTKTTDLTKLNADDLAAELARREAEAAEQETARAERLEQARHAWAAETWANRDQTEENLKARGEQAREDFSAAVKAGDLPGAFAAWMHERAARYAREATRNKAQNAGMTIGDDLAPHMPPLRRYSPDFLSRLEEEADSHARANGYDLADELVPDAPTEA